MTQPAFEASAPVMNLSENSSANTDVSVKKAHIIVIGNEKGGCGKTTTCMHLIVALMRLGFSVGTIDIDSRQRSLSRYLENRRQTILKENIQLPQPQHVVVQRSQMATAKEAEADDRERFTKTLERLVAANDFVVVDSPGNDTYLSRVAHAYADTIITPINDSFVDLDVLANVDGQTMKIIKPSIYSEMVWEQKLARAKRNGGSIEWIVMRNRLSNIDAKNKRFMTQATEELARRIGFRVAPGFSERVIFREMFLQGLTVLDIMEMSKSNISISHVAARQEVRDLLKSLRLPMIDERSEKQDDVADESLDIKKEDNTPSKIDAQAKVDDKDKATSSPVDEGAALSKDAEEKEEKVSATLGKETEVKPEAVSEIKFDKKEAVQLSIEPELEALAS